MFKENNTEPFVFSDSHVGRWTIEAVNLLRQAVYGERQLLLFIDVKSPCQHAVIHFADPAIRDGVFDFDVRYEDVNLNYNLMDWDTLDLSTSGYSEMFVDQQGSCP